MHCTIDWHYDVRSMTDFDKTAQDIGTMADGIRLHRQTLKAGAAPLEMHNVSDVFLMILPLRHGHVRVVGEPRFFFDGAVQPGMIRLVQPGERAMMTVQADFEHATFFIPGSVFRGHAAPAGLRIEGDICPEVAPLIRSNQMVQRLIPLFEMAKGMSKLRRQMLVHGLATTLMALLLDVEIHRPQDLAATFDEAEFQQVLHFAEARLNQHLELADWAAAVGLSTSEFARRFQTHTGAAPYTWFMERRIDLAKRLMVQSTTPLVDVALEAGFCSQSHFTEAFRRRVGTSPGRWRKAQFQRDEAPDPRNNVQVPRQRVRPS